MTDMRDVPNSSGSDWQAARAEGIRNLEESRYREAVNALERAAAGDPGTESEGLLGVAHFMAEQYGEAVRHFEAALESQPGNSEWSALLERARANLEAQVQRPVPERYHFEREKLLAPPSTSDGDLPQPPPPSTTRVFLRTKFLRWLGTQLGWIGTWFMRAATQLLGTLMGYRDRVWTNWYRRNIYLGILTLAYMRERLNKNNLWVTYPAGTLAGFQKAGQKPPVGATHFRTADGSWNNLRNPKEGAAGTRFPRNIRREAIRLESTADLLTPNPREISRVLLTREGPMKEIPFLNLFAAAWIQFQNSDWISHGENLSTDAHEIPLAEDDPFRKRFRQSKIFVGKTQPDPTRSGQEDFPVTFVNEVTHWWDGSQIYGSDPATVNRLRSKVDGKLRLQADGRLTERNGVEDTGFVRNWWVGQSLLHTLFTREHNAICDRLKLRYPHWDDHRLFNVARLVNAAVMAKIHSVEWTPAVLPNPGLSLALNANWYGTLTNLLRSDRDRKTVAAINVHNPELGGVVGNPINRQGKDYGLTQEFVEIYRLHSFLPETLAITRLDGSSAESEVLPFAASRQSGSARLTGRYRMPDLLQSFGSIHPGQLILNNYPRFLQELSIPGNPLFDMGAVDILRARERGVPRYNEFRRQLGLNPIQTFRDLTPDPAQIAKLEAIYGNDVEKLDLLIGTLGEHPTNRPRGFGFGETMFQIFILNATRRLQADRFYTDNYNEETYTREGLDWVDEADLKTVLLRHHPELSASGLSNIKNAFEPWDTARVLDRNRHPLREFDKDLGKDPWLGDRWR